ncbi:MAG: glycosyl hydrolase family 79 C-terminal domain-containing protein [Solirubrobacteraceae bacterium]
MSLRPRIPRLIAIVLGGLLALAVVALWVIDPTGRADAPRSAPAHRHASAGSRPLVRAPRSTTLPFAVVTVPGQGRAQAVPRSFLGLSTEYWTLPFYQGHLPLLERVLSLLHVSDGGPMIVRIGGDSADHTFWVTKMQPMPRWAFRIGPSWLRLPGLLAARDHVRLLLDLNLVTGSSPGAARWARAANRYLPRGSIMGFEIGNEPDIYDRWQWLAQLGRGREAAALPRRLSAGTYLNDFRAYAHVLAHVAPHVPLVAPALANPAVDVGWLGGLIAGAHPGLGLVSVHRYPYSACVRRRSASYPSIPRVLSDNATVGLARSIAPAVRLAQHAHLPIRLTELNSVTCGGLRGVSDTFATALWAPDALFQLVKAGVDGANIHVRAFTANAAFVITRRGLIARPLLYGMILFARALGPDARLVPVRLSSSHRSLQLKVWAIRVGPGVWHVLLISKGAQGARVDLRLPASGPATVQRLQAPTVSARGGMTLAGQQLDRAGRWRGSFVSQALAPGRGGYSVTVPRFSAALVTVRSSQLR